MPDGVAYLLFAGACVGHAAVWVPVLNNLYGRRIPKYVLKSFRAFVGVLMLAGWVGELTVPIYRGVEVTGFAQDDSGVDVALSDGAVYRIFQDRETDGWFIDAIVD